MESTQITQPYRLKASSISKETKGQPGLADNSEYEI